MSNHDPLCWAANDGRLQHACGCAMIRQARADEREKVAQAIEAEEQGLAGDGDYNSGMLRAARIARAGE